MNQPKDLIQTAYALYQQEKFDEALSLLDTIAELPSSQYVRGLVYFDKEQWILSESAFKKAIELTPSAHLLGFVHYWLARTYDYLPIWDQVINPVYDKEKAEMHYKTAVECEDFPEDAFVRLAKKEHKEFRIIWYQKGIQRFPEYRKFYILAARDLHKNQLPSRQLELLQLGAASGANGSAIQFSLGEYYQEHRKLDPALQHYHEALPFELSGRA
jgi:tetratricopeptide (TPR) repeat protein